MLQTDLGIVQSASVFGGQDVVVIRQTRQYDDRVANRVGWINGECNGDSKFHSKEGASFRDHLEIPPAIQATVASFADRHL